MVSVKSRPPTVKVNIEVDDYERLAVMPWYTFKVYLPVRPLPAVSDRPRIRTRRLVIRSILMSDLESFHILRRQSDTQIHSTSRGRPDRDMVETKEYVERLQQEDQAHWYFGAFLASSGELIGEGGLPDCLSVARSGWPEGEILLKQEYRRQGYGTEIWEAVMDSWWTLPRRLVRHQLLPAIVPNKEPGEHVPEGVGVMWEGSNIAARNFFAKMLGQSQMSVSGTLDAMDMRDGRAGNIVSWAGVVMGNPYAVDCEQA